MTKEQEQNIEETAKLSATIDYIIERSKDSDLSIQELCDTIAALATRRMMNKAIEEADELDYENSMYVNAEEEAEANGGYSNQS